VNKGAQLHQHRAQRLFAAGTGGCRWSPLGYLYARSQETGKV
jgi:hypothetical protein